METGQELTIPVCTESLARKCWPSTPALNKKELIRGQVEINLWLDVISVVYCISMCCASIARPLLTSLAESICGPPVDSWCTYGATDSAHYYNQHRHRLFLYRWLNCSLLLIFSYMLQTAYQLTDIVELILVHVCSDVNKTVSLKTKIKTPIFKTKTKTLVPKTET